MGSFGEEYENIVLDVFLGSTGAYTAPATLYFGLATTDLTDTGGYVGKEPSSDTAYARVAVTNTSSNFTAAETSGGKGVKYNAAAISFAAVTCSSWATVTYAFICDTSSAEGNLLCWGALTAEKNLDVGDTASFAANSFKITLD